MDPDAFAGDWEKLEQQTRDGSLFGGGSDEPCFKVVSLCRQSGLRRFHPFTSMNRLCFARSRFPFEDLQPAFIEFDRGDRYVVRNGQPYAHKADAPIELETDDPSSAAAATCRLLGVDGVA